MQHIFFVCMFKFLCLTLYSLVCDLVQYNVRSRKTIKILCKQCGLIDSKDLWNVCNFIWSWRTKSVFIGRNFRKVVLFHFRRITLISRLERAVLQSLTELSFLPSPPSWWRHAQEGTACHATLWVIN